MIHQDLLHLYTQLKQFHYFNFYRLPIKYKQQQIDQYYKSVIWYLSLFWAPGFCGEEIRWQVLITGFTTRMGINRRRHSLVISIFCTVHVGLRNQMWIQAVTGTAGEKDLAVRTNSGCAGLLGTLHCVLVQVVAHHPLGSFLIGASDTCDTAMHPLVDNIFCLVHLSTASHNPVNINS